EERPERGGNPLAVLGGGGQRLAGDRGELLRALVPQRQEELELAGEVLVQHGLADAGPVGDVVHGRGVIALRNEHFLGSAEQLPSAGLPRQPRGCWAGLPRW